MQVKLGVSHIFAQGGVQICCFLWILQVKKGGQKTCQGRRVWPDPVGRGMGKGTLLHLPETDVNTSYRMWIHTATRASTSGKRWSPKPETQIVIINDSKPSKTAGVVKMWKCVEHVWNLCKVAHVVNNVHKTQVTLHVFWNRCKNDTTYATTNAKSRMLSIMCTKT